MTTSERLYNKLAAQAVGREAASWLRNAHNGHVADIESYAYKYATAAAHFALEAQVCSTCKGTGEELSGPVFTPRITLCKECGGKSWVALSWPRVR